MKYQVGDEIIVLHSNEEGRIIEIMNEEMVMIEVRGVKFPAYMDQIDFPYFKRFSEKKLFTEKIVPPKLYIDQIPKEKIKKSDWNSMQENIKNTDKSIKETLKEKQSKLEIMKGAQLNMTQITKNISDLTSLLKSDETKKDA